jgi:hypothetical protein
MTHRGVFFLVTGLALRGLGVRGRARLGLGVRGRGPRGLVAHGRALRGRALRGISSPWLIAADSVDLRNPRREELRLD